MKFLQRQQFLFAKIALVVILFITLHTPRQANAAAFQANNYGASPTMDVASVDLNNDGNLDLATVLQPGNGNSSVSIRLGNGDGTFGAATAYTFSGNSSAITFADFNGDSNIDLATASGVPSSYSILLGNGDGTFQPPLFASTGSTPNYLAAADFDKDGKIDLAMTYSGGSNVYVKLGNGDGTFQASTSFGTGSGTYQLTAKDFDGDGNPDLAVVSFIDRQVSVLLGNGDGTFAVKVDYPTGQYSQRVATGDLNKDGILDMVVCSSSGSITILLGNGDGTFQNLGNKSFGVDPRAVLIGDFIGDGEVDILIANFGVSSNIFSIFEGHGDGTFKASKRYGYSGEGGASLQMMSGDFNEDGWLDVVLIKQLGSTVDVVLANHRNAQLQSLNLSGGAALHMPFHTETLTYTSSVPYSVYGIDVTPTVTDATATVTVGVYGDTPEAVDSGQPSSSLPLSVGVNTIEVTITAQDGTTTQTYTLKVTRVSEESTGGGSVPLSSNADLKQLTVKANGDELKLTPVFTAETTSYQVQTSADEVSIEAFTSDAGASVTLGEATLVGGKIVALTKGDNAFEIIVKAENGTVKSYSMTIQRQTVIAPLPAESLACTFLDINGHWAEFQICEAAEKGIVKGISEKEFDPQGLVTRVEFTAMLLRTLGVTSEHAADKLSFTDQVQIPAWAVHTVSPAVKMGIVQGYSDGSFRPMQTVSRSEMAAMLARAMNWDITQGIKTTFADDTDIPKWARESIYTAAGRGLLNGRDGNRFVPDGMATRAEATAVVLRVWNLSRSMDGQGQTGIQSPERG